MITMKFNWTPSRVAFIDYETQSRQDLTSLRKYIRHQSTRAVCCCVRIDGVTHRIGPYFGPADLEFLAKVAADRTLVAHNAPFDRAVHEELLGLPAAEWYDTLPCARAAGLPGPLDQLGKVLEGRGKDPNGDRLKRMLCFLKGPAPAVGPIYQLLLDYNERDVDLLETVFHRVHGFGEPEVMTADRAINDRGVSVDRAYLETVLALMEHHTRVSEDNFERLSGGVNPRSNPQMVEWMTRMGFDVLDKDTGKQSVSMNVLKQLIARPDDFYVGDDSDADCIDVVLQALEERRDAVRVGSSKLRKALEALDDDDRIRDQFVYGGAHTLRWTGRAFQMHNLPSGGALRSYDTLSVPPDYGSVVAAAADASEKFKERLSVADVLATFIRHIVRSPIGIVYPDYGAVEARCLAWMADEPRMLSTYNDPSASLYIDMGRTIFGRTISKAHDKNEYTLAKAVVLGCGYSMSGAKFALINRKRDLTEAMLGRVDPKEAVKAYRTAYPAIPKLWKAMDDAVNAAVAGRDAYAGRCYFHMDGPDLHMVLPSGRPLVYRNARVEMVVPLYCAMYNMPEIPKPTVVYDNPRGYRGFLYGGKITENADQAMCRDLVADSLVKAENLGLDPVLHVHDEVGCECDSSHLEELTLLMSEGPPWAAGFPILVEGAAGPVWTKNTDTYKKCVALRGRLV